ncbi:MAG TPA: LysR family transcriptional regulator [Bryobacteraceae bacterium]|nr:LysR family transcriptional regulator [Bryobacteraceae bacterium]
MAFDHLRLFLDIAQARSVSRGAAQSGLSQSAASQHLQELERQIGTILLDRSTRPLTVTPAGSLYADFCRDVLRRRDDFEIALERLKAELEGTVRVASIYSVGLSEMSHLKAEFMRRYPKARIEVEYLRPEKVYEAVLADRVDLGLVSYPEATKEIQVIPWREEEMVIAVAPGHPLAVLRRIRPRDLAGLDFVAFDEDLPIRHRIDRFLRDNGVAVRIALHFDNIQSIKEAVTHGAAFSILPARVLTGDVGRGRLLALPLEGDLVRPLGIIHRRRKNFHRAAAMFLELLEEHPTPVSAGV